MQVLYRSPFFNFRDYIECDGGKVYDRYTEWFPDDKEAIEQSNVLLAYKLMFGVHVDPEFRHISWNYYEEELHRGNQEAFELALKVSFEPLPDYFPNANGKCLGWAITVDTNEWLWRQERKGKIILPDGFWLRVLKEGNCGGKLYAMIYLRDAGYPRTELIKLIEKYALATAPDSNHTSSITSTIRVMKRMAIKHQEKAAT